MTSKYWGKGPWEWTAEDLQFNEYDVISFGSTTASPGLLGQSPPTQTQPVSYQPIPNPERFCRYAIHVIHQRLGGDYEDGSDTFDTEDIGEWSEEVDRPPIEVRLCQSLESNDFSNIPNNTLPLAVAHIANAAKRSTSELLGESLTFAIMARNSELVQELLERAHDEDIDLSSTYCLHVATSYLNGGSSCCMILDLCCYSDMSGARRIYFNEHGHTVLDNLILTILKGHSRTPVDAIDDTLKRQPRFAGSEVDLCGRWDADDHCYRSLLQSGKTEIPFHWKHKFCHTSVQAVYHCIVSLNQNAFPLQTDSGIFVKYCTNPSCGRKLQLGPLHALILATFRLALDGCDDEDLFGMSAVLLCLLSCRLKSYETAHISLPLLFDSDSSDECSHWDIMPLQLAQSLPITIIASWDGKKQVGWQIFCHILRLADQMQERPSSDFADEDDELFTSVDMTSDTESCFRVDRFPDQCEDPCFEYRGELCFEESNQLGHLWAAFQAEILTHRRQNDDDPWVSERFDMQRLLASLEDGTGISLPMLDRDLLLPYCKCGIFGHRGSQMYVQPVMREAVMTSYFGNLDIWIDPHTWMCFRDCKR